MLGRVPHQDRLPGQPVRVPHFGGVCFLGVKAADWDNSPGWGNQITRVRQDISTISPPNPPKRR